MVECSRLNVTTDAKGVTKDQRDPHCPGTRNDDGFKLGNADRHCILCTLSSEAVQSHPTQPA